MAAAAAHLPDAFVGLGPGAFEMLEECDLHRPALGAAADAAAARLMQRVHKLAVNVELQLVVRAVADAHGRRVAESLEPRHVPFAEPPFAGDAVHDLRLLGPPGDG